MGRRSNHERPAGHCTASVSTEGHGALGPWLGGVTRRAQTGRTLKTFLSTWMQGSMLHLLSGRIPGLCAVLKGPLKVQRVLTYFDCARPRRGGDSTLELRQDTALTLAHV